MEDKTFQSKQVQNKVLGKLKFWDLEILGEKSEEKFEIRDCGTSVLLLTSHKENRYE